MCKREGTNFYPMLPDEIKIKQNKINKKSWHVS